MLRGILSGLVLASLMALSGCWGGSSYPTVPPAPPAGTVKDAPPATESTSGVIEEGPEVQAGPVESHRTVIVIARKSDRCRVRYCGRILSS